MIGTCEFAWRDRTGLLRDRQSAVILPRGFKATIRSTGDYIDIILAGCSGATEVLPAVKVENNYWRILTKGTYQASASIRFVTANLPPTVLTVRLPHRARICDWETRALPPRHRISLATLHRFVAIAAGRSELMAQLLDSNNRRIPQAEMRWIFEEELSLNTIHDDLAALLRPLGDLDASIELNFNGGYEACWHVCEFDIALASEPRGLVPTKAIVDEYARFVGRALQNPNFEMDFGPYGLSEQSSHRPISLPSSKGCWLFYIRNGNGVLTRPYLYRGQDQDHTSPDGLGFAMAIPDKLARMGRLETLCEDVESAGEKGLLFLRSIISLACGLAGLPPSTFDVFQLVARRPLLATRLLFEASEPELPALLALDASLPFSWPLIPKRYWDRAAELRFETLIAALPEILSDRLALAAGAIATARGRISAIEPTTSPLLNQSMPFKTISEAAQTFMHRAHDRVEGFALSPFRPQLTKYLPNWDFHNQYWRALDAPCAAAQAARRELRLDDGQLRCVKDVARRHPRYFLEAFSAIFREPLIG
jgi:hypothetical protein